MRRNSHQQKSLRIDCFPPLGRGCALPYAARSLRVAWMRGRDINSANPSAYIRQRRTGPGLQMGEAKLGATRQHLSCWPGMTVRCPRLPGFSATLAQCKVRSRIRLMPRQRPPKLVCRCTQSDRALTGDTKFLYIEPLSPH